MYKCLQGACKYSLFCKNGIAIMICNANFQDTSIFTIPGLYGSGPDHWQTIWEKLYGFTRIEQHDWDSPSCSEWNKSLLEQMGNRRKVIFIAHSLGCHLLLKCFYQLQNVIKGILLVAPPDPGCTVIKRDLSSFEIKVPFKITVPGVLVCSENDPYASIVYSEEYGRKFGLSLINIGKCGHINSDSHLGDWDEGAMILCKLVEQVNF